MLHVVCCMLHGICCMLHIVCCMLHGVCCMLHGVCCMLHIVCCMLHLTHCALLGSAAPYSHHRAARREAATASGSRAPRLGSHTSGWRAEGEDVLLRDGSCAYVRAHSDECLPERCGRVVGGPTDSVAPGRAGCHGRLI